MKFTVNLILNLFVLWLIPIFSFYAPDEITNLPGWTEYNGPLPTKQYSGYLSFADNNKHLHYWLVESEVSSETAPLVLWFNGGPGCSSLDGFFYEHGPFEVSSDGKQLTLREHRWSRLANILYIEQPVGVGFSYSESKNYHHNDDTSAIDNLAGIEKFFELFPEYLSNPFYITGESYAGIYVPMLAYHIINAENDGTYHGAKLTGIGVGNGCTGSEVGICANYFANYCQGVYYQMEYLLSLSFTNADLKANINKECNWQACLAPGAKASVLSNKCTNLINKASYEMGIINIYNVYGTCKFDACDGPSALTSSTTTTNNNGDNNNNVNNNELFSKLGPRQSNTQLLMHDKTIFQSSMNAMSNSYKEGQRINKNIKVNTEEIPQAESEKYNEIYERVYGKDYVINKKNNQDTTLMNQQQQTQQQTTQQQSILNQQGSINTNNNKINIDTTNINNNNHNINNHEIHTQSIIDVTDDDANSDFNQYYGFGPAGCIDSFTATTYLMNPEVQKALHVKPLDYCWAVCNQAKGFHYTSNQPNLPRDIYPTLISKIRVLIFNGDWDACVPYTDNQAWTERMGMTPSKPWHPWAYTLHSDDTVQIGGYSVKYDVTTFGNGSFEFRTVRGAGHMVPSDAPEQGLAILGHLLSQDFDSDDPYQLPSLNTHTPCDTTSSTSASTIHSLQAQRTGVVITSVVLGILLIVVIMVLGTKIHRLQSRLKQNANVVEFNNMSSDADNIRLTSMPYVSVLKQDEA